MKSSTIKNTDGPNLPVVLEASFKVLIAAAIATQVRCPSAQVRIPDLSDVGVDRFDDAEYFRMFMTDAMAEADFEADLTAGITRLRDRLTLALETIQGLRLAERSGQRLALSELPKAD